MHRRPPRIFKTLLLGLLALLALGLVAAPAVAGPAPFTTTELISGSFAAAVNGNNLLNAVALAGPNTLIKLEPGVYDLQGQQILLPDFVDIEGSGRDITTIFSDLTASPTPTVIDVAPGINGEIRELTVQAFAGLATGITVRSDELLLTEVNLEIEGEDLAIGVRIDGASPRLDEVFVRILGSGGNANGFQVEGGGGPVLFSCLVFASGVTKNARGILVDDASPTIEGSILFTVFNGTNTGILVSGTTSDATIRNVRVLAQGSRSTGVLVQKEANALIKESSFDARSDDRAIGIDLQDGTAKATESTFDAAPFIFATPNVFAARLGGSSNLDSNQSNYQSTSFAVDNAGAGQARFGASQLIGTASPAAVGPLVCVYAYDGAYAQLNNICQ